MSAEDTPPADDLETQLIAFITNEFLDAESPIDRDDDLLSGDLLDSVAALQLANHVQARYQLAMEPSDFVIDNFRTVAVLAAFIRSRLPSA